MTNSTILTVILNYKTADMTLKAAKAADTAMDGIKGAITIVDNDSQDGSYEAILAEIETGSWPGNVPVQVLASGRNGGFGYGNNVGILAGLPDGTQPDYVYLLNSDAFPAANAIRILADHLDTHPQTSFAGSHLHGEDGEGHLSAFRFPTIASEFEGAARTGFVSKMFQKSSVWMPIPDFTGPVDWLAGASVMMRQSALDEIGLFDERFFLYFEETELFLRAARHGHRSDFVHQSHVAHIGGATTGMDTWKRVPSYWFQSRWYYFAKTEGRLYALAATAAHLAGALVWQTRRLLQGKPRLDPDKFFPDMIRHDLSALFRPVPKPHFPAQPGAADVS
jgi:GT2 family glycosyltransferase